MPLGMAIHNIEITLGKGGQLARAAGAVAKLIAKEGKSATLKLPSREVRLISKNCSATVGQVGNVGVNQKSLGRAGSKRWLGKRPVVEEMLREYNNICTLRLRMPISSDLSNSRNFITKITRYNKVVNIPNSMSVLDELLPISIEMAKRKCKGLWNFTNPGVVSHNEILQLYREYINPNFKWANFDLEEQAKVISAPRSNNELDASKLKKEFPELLSIKDSIIKNVFEPNKRSK
ncbi:bifunctional polymyxin resistance protein, ArnA [Artemisia annua]|uniref:Bifunctional polymyxin resistance protein, ArnA n=1 Tax=Artemisia annua TaxID=35608 RepID=A0A2U1NB66_ARTAN|nr:bifunctional polymyxin resistance protein, ArnA [Artemisia annua]